MSENILFVFKNNFGFIFLTMVVAYLIGCVNSALVVGKILKTNKDIRTVGSGNAGFTNALRTMGKKTAVLTFVGDFTKGVVAVWFGIYMSSLNSGELSMLKFQIFAYTAAFMCVIGHIYPCFFKFKGGKGVLTTWATSLLIDPRVFLILILTFLLVFLLSKIVSLSSVCAAIAYPISTFLLGFSNSRLYGFSYVLPTVFTFFMALIVVVKHKGNILRIINGTEKKLSINKQS